MAFVVKDELVRRNVTLNEFAADNLKTMSDFTGYTQGEILEMALNQPAIQRLKAFASSNNPVVDLLEAYQCDEGHMSRRAGESILQTIKDWVQEYATVKSTAALSKQLPHTNSYIGSHMTKYSMDADEYFKLVHDSAQKDAFLTTDMSSDAVRDTVIVYIDAMLNGADDKRIIMESYLFRNLLVMLEDCFEIPTAADVKRIYNDLSDGYVLPSKAR